MKLLTASLSLAALLASGAALAQPASPSPPDALALLQQVSKRYADATSYHIKAIEEFTQSQEFDHSWSKTVYTAAEAPGGRYRFEGQTGWGSTVYVSDGKSRWLYNARTRLYTQETASAAVPNESASKASGPIGTASGAKHLRDSLARLAKGYKSATLLPDEVITVDGRQVPSFVVLVTTSDLKRNSVSGKFSLDERIWIDKSKMTVVKRVQRQHNYLSFFGEVQLPMYQESAIVYPIADLDPQDLDATLFSFSPPQDAKLVDRFPEHNRSELVGKTAPPLTLKAPDGKQVSLDSFRGEPVLVDFWATWCSPCVESLPKLARLYEQTKDKGLVVLTIDRDEEAKDAADFLAKNHYQWRNFHDDGEISKPFGEQFGIPRAVLIDATGKIVYDKVGNDDSDELAAAVAGLGPEYAFLSSKPKQEPCIASK